MLQAVQNGECELDQDRLPLGASAIQGTTQVGAVSVASRERSHYYAGAVPAVEVASTVMAAYPKTGSGSGFRRVQLAPPSLAPTPPTCPPPPPWKPPRQKAVGKASGGQAPVGSAAQATSATASLVAARQAAAVQKKTWGSSTAAAASGPCSGSADRPQDPAHTRLRSHRSGRNYYTNAKRARIQAKFGKNFIARDHDDEPEEVPGDGAARSDGDDEPGAPEADDEDKEEHEDPPEGEAHDLDYDEDKEEHEHHDSRRSRLQERDSRSTSELSRQAMGLLRYGTYKGRSYNSEHSSSSSGRRSCAAMAEIMGTSTATIVHVTRTSRAAHGAYRYEIEMDQDDLDNPWIKPIHWESHHNR